MAASSVARPSATTGPASSPLISSQVEPESFTDEPDGAITVAVRAVVHDANTGELVSDSHIRHRYHLEDGLVTRMDVIE